ncbi:MAG: hypothetical protein ACJA0Z_002937 [Halioglobus sp.]|jgi:hypothetical protein
MDQFLGWKLTTFDHLHHFRVTMCLHTVTTNDFQLPAHESEFSPALTKLAYRSM